MNVITKKSLACKVAWRWKRQYMVDEEFVKPEYIDPNYRDKGKIYKELIALGPDPDSDDVDRVIGNTSWTTLACHECGKEVDAVIQLGQEPDYESATALICWACITEAHMMLDQEK